MLKILQNLQRNFLTRSEPDLGLCVPRVTACDKQTTGHERNLVHPATSELASMGNRIVMRWGMYPITETIHRVSVCVRATEAVIRKRTEIMLASVVKFLKSEDGPTAVEYAVMLALIVIVCLTAIRAVGTNANARFNQISNQLT